MAQSVLIVEDESNIVASLAFLLERDGFTVETTNDGALALERLREVRPDVVILDVMLPNVSGFDVLKRLRAEPGPLQETPVMMLTAKGQSKDREQAEALGANVFVTKPFSNTEIVDHVRTLAGRGQSPT